VQLETRIHQEATIGECFEGRPNLENVPAKNSKVELVEATPKRYVLDILLGRVIVEPDSVRFHKNGRGRGITVVSRKAE
jgi:hypothetical protein